MKNTNYEEVFAEFKDKITDPDLITFAEDLQTEMLVAYMKKAISKCKRVIKTVDLSNRDDELMEFSFELPDEVMDIITEWMTVFWLQPFVNNIENLRNNLSTKDFSVFSPANLLEKIGDRYDIARKHARSLTNEYSYIIADMKELKA
jgi:hypothetical protein